MSGDVLGPYVPHLVHEWIAEDPGRQHRTIRGTLVFADVSGFTRISERLARRGRVGAETIVGVIETCFARLLDVAGSRGGTLVQFAGDAVLLFFQGPGHEARAAAAALEMRHAIRSMGDATAATAGVRLSLTVGVHTADFEWFLVGDSHRQLVLGGAAASHLVALEAAAERGQVLVGQATADCLGRRNLVTHSGVGSRLVGSISPAPYDAPALAPMSATTTRGLVAAGLRRTLAEGRVESEHRTATLAFVEFTGLDAMIEQLGGEEAARRLQTLMASTQAAIDHRGICLQSADLAVDGGKLYLTAGAPLSTGQDEEVMLLALQEILATDVGLVLRAGVTSGPVFTGEIRMGERSTFVTMGDAVNLAARVMGRAAPGAVYATTPVLDRSRTLFDLTPVEPFHVKGKQHAVVAHEVGPARNVRHEVASAEVPLVGREAEVAAFASACAAAHAGSGTYLRVVADAGAGKTRLLAEFEATAGSTAFHRVGCRLYQSSTPYFPFSELLGELMTLSDTDRAGDLRREVTRRCPDLLPWLSLIGAVCGVVLEPSPEVAALEPEFRRRQLETTVVSLLDRLLPGPTAVCIEDAQWMDDASAQLVDALVAGLGERPWVVLLTQRPVAGAVEQIRPADVLLALEPLDETALVRLVTELTRSRPLAEHRVAALVERSGGNPLYLLELVNAAKAGDDEALPTSLEGLLTARIDRLDPAERTLLRHLSVLGGGFDTAYVEAVAPAGTRPDADALARLGEFVDTDADGWVRFRHSLVRDVAYGGLPFRTRRVLHERVGESILARVGDDVDDVTPLLSLHFHAANRHQEAWRHSTVAGDRAKAVYANVDAARLYRRALQSAARIDVEGRLRARTWESLGDVEELTGNLLGARKAYVAARALSDGDPVLDARMLLKSAFIDEQLGRFVTAVRSVRRGLRLLEPVGREGDELRAELWGWLAATRLRQGRFADGARAAREAVRLADPLGDSSTLARALMTLDFARSRLEADADVAGTRRALSIYTDLGDVPGEAAAANMLGAYAYFAGQWDDAVKLYRRSRNARERTGDAAGVATANANLAEVLLEQGALDEAVTLLDSASSVWRATEDQWSVAFADRLRGLCRCRAGDFTGAEALLRDARSAFVALGAGADVVETDIAIAELLVLSGRAEEAVAVLDGVIEEAGSADSGVDHLLPAAHRLRGTARSVLVTDAGFDDLTRSLELSREHEAEHEVALAIRALQVVGGWRDQPVDPALAAEGAALEARLGLRERLVPARR